MIHTCGHTQSQYMVCMHAVSRDTISTAGMHVHVYRHDCVCIYGCMYVAFFNIHIISNLYADDTTLHDFGLDKDTLENNLQNSLNLLKMWCLENGMIINIDKTKLMLISSRQKKKCMKDNKLAIEYDNFDLQLTSCEKVLGVHIDDSLTWTNPSQHVSKNISSYLWLLSQIKIILFFTTQSVILQCLY